MKMKVLRVVSELALLSVLFDGSIGLICGDLHFGTGLFGDLDDEIEDTITQVQWHIVPGGDLLLR